MTSRLDGRVALITGAARGQGRSHAIRLAQDGADIIALDICAPIDSVTYPLATPEDLAETEKAVRELGRQVLTRQVDVRDRAAFAATLAETASVLGDPDIVVANAGIAPLSVHPTEAEWQDVLDVNLTGVRNTVDLTTAPLVERGTGGSVVLISSTAGLNGIAVATPGGLAYTAAKHGVVGLMRAYANALAPHSIRVNTVHPTGTRTPMIVNDAVEELINANKFMADTFRNALPVEMIEPVDVANAVAWLVSDEARYVTGITLPVDAGYTNRK